MKMKLYIAILLFFVLGFQQANAQHVFFPEQGVITYDKTVHVKNMMKRQISMMKESDFQRKFFEDMLTKVPETAVLQRKLTFSGSESMLEPLPKDQPAMVAQLLRFGFLDYGTKIYQNLATKQTSMSLEVGGSPIAISDSLTNVKWKITNEYRNIAGYDCRRANGVTLDSVYVVAFYTDQIPLASSPSTLHGLPGMILGLVVPEQNFNIYASKVEMTGTTVTDNLIKKKGNAFTREQTRSKMREVLGQWLSEKQFGLFFAAMML